ncbi:MAG: biopolymer transporter ExbD [Methylotenera sp.]|uniref:ExbD/TolR family protein n=1 Tax=Methylotenera sp. TaxID=2051956 RepID=UPI00271879EB|nr:biopolymer transporter ExbD [Methylotenera sp.]MDO9203832.1 biopolymer transporter ExbD [Methylotenera sp.]MDO9393765.1 biopolymer transporter ExbD [Methylotenera sp.]MDP2231286.1 biopolymer transporter ExbD [Methylotenera sp.]MDP3140348.1 biopolymer transporter ExbD [Methylotenera sp.]MDZ4210931.1 biopolymer transporter ExbD [Methylotenera sp.]
MIGVKNSVSVALHTAPMSEINTTPLVDVMLVLLVIFIITAPLLTHAVRIDLPQTSSQPLPEKPEVISVSIDTVGKMYWNDVPMEQGELKVKLQQIANQKPQPELNIRADKETRYQVLAEVMADAQSVGISKLGFVSEPKH